MPNSRNWSTASAPCRLEWRPSRLLASALRVLGVLAGVALLACELPLMWSVPAAAPALVEGERLARRHLRQPVRQLVLVEGTAPRLDDEPLADARLHWRGTLAFLSFRDGYGALRRLSWWPDTLDARARRELRLAWAVQAGARASRSMAP